MRLALLTLPLLAACADETASSSAYQGYDPAADVEAAPAQGTASADAVRAAEVTQPWFADHTKTFAGFTAPQIGRIVAPGVEPGFASADALCKDLGADHMCSADEIRKAEAAGEFGTAPIDRTFWLSEARDQKGNCNGWTYPTNDRGWGQFAKVTTTHAVQYVVHPAVEFDPTCNRDVTTCPSVIPTGFECNVARSVACCF